ncbi:DUF3304 domain-containing protein [Paraburkholderia pallida]|uniref:DUF3304 domain-containing protein n=1 Tax=Paraburkholderia pallida TaxID=2547399 RepID=A0A4P7CTS4_9BURK|nr:DUF3304 domain-containing protein [Paraburkholderia pallida]QBQ97654.1 DUF3304 domain-containing protein [Paraburkholderia pallida]
MAQGRETQTLKGLKKAVAALALMVTTAGCLALGQQGYVEVSERSANYTEMYIDYAIHDPNDKSVGLSGDAKPFSKGGAGGRSCCALLPGPGQTIRVEWGEEDTDFDQSKKRHYTRDVVVIGQTPVSSDSYNYLITRFFPSQQIEVELVSRASEDVGNGPPSPRLDQLFYGRKVMRHMGE